MYRVLFLALIALAGSTVALERAAEACGVRLTIRAPAVKRPSERSKNPSRILLLGDPPRALASELTRRGHKVEVASSPDQTQEVRFHAIVADQGAEDDARARWPRAIVVVRGGDAKADAAEVEARLRAAPTRVLIARTPLRTSREARQPVRVGPPTNEERGAPVAAGAGSGDTGAPIAAGGSSDPDGASDVDTAADTEAPPPPTRVATRSEVRRSTATERPGRLPSRHAVRRVFFEASSSSLSSSSRRKLAGTAQWLKRNEGRSVLVEGHASATGQAAANQSLSEARARAVKDYLVEQGVEDSRIETEAHGMNRPEYRPPTSAKNRRVVIRIR